MQEAVTGGDIGDSKVMYDAVKAYLAKVRSVDTGRGSQAGANLAPIYAVLLDDADYPQDKSVVNRGKLVLTDRKTLIDKAIGGIYAIVTEAYTNADTTLSFKLKFVNKPTIA